jgi:hypothetical protein
MTEYLHQCISTSNQNADRGSVGVAGLQRRVQHFAKDAVQPGRPVKYSRPHAAETIRDANLAGVHRVPRCGVDDGVDAGEIDVCRSAKHRGSTGSNRS